MNRLIEHLRRSPDEGAGQTDGQLLDLFVRERDGAALAALVRRHAPMVWGVCRRILSAHHDAEDAFQATFLVLVRKAEVVPRKELVGNWLYGVARQTAVRMRALAARRGVRERQVAVMPEPTSADEYLWNDLRPVLDGELARLPDKYRVLLVLCDLEGRTRKDVARRLAIPEGTVASRLATARAMLAKRLSRRGVVVSGSLLGAVLASRAAADAVPPAVLASAIRTTALAATGQGVAGAVSPTVSALITGVTNAMRLSKIKFAAAVVLVVGLTLGGVGLGAGLFTGSDARAQPPTPEDRVKPPAGEERAKAPPKQEKEKEKEAFTAWGKEVNGLQAGLGFRPGEKRAYRHGETVSLVVRVRNVSKNTIKSYYHVEFLEETSPAVSDGNGNAVPVAGKITAGGIQGLGKVDLAPGKEIELYDLKLVLQPSSEQAKKMLRTLYGTGTFHIQYKQVDRVRSATEEFYLDEPLLDKLATGKLELEVQEAADVPGKKKEEQESVTAWGTEVGGLQAGLGPKAGTKRVYHHGETVTLVVRVRNVGKEEVTFQYLRHFFIENPPTVSDDQGKAVALKDGTPKGIYKPIDVTLAPGKEVDLYELSLTLAENSTDPPKDSTLYGEGTFRIQYERVLGNSSLSSVSIKFDPILSKLATGKLELELKPPGRRADTGDGPLAVGSEGRVTEAKNLREAVEQCRKKLEKDGCPEFAALVTEQRVKDALKQAVADYEAWLKVKPGPPGGDANYFADAVRPVAMQLIEAGVWPKRCALSWFPDVVEGRAKAREGFYLRLQIDTPGAKFEGFSFPIIDLSFGRWAEPAGVVGNPRGDRKDDKPER